MIRFLLSLAFGLTFILAEAQDYLPMLSTEHTWSVDFKYGILPPGCEPNCDYIQTEQITLRDPIIVDGKTYLKVFTENGATSCLVREEGGIVYQLDAANNVEIVKYDFTLEVGDFFNFEEIYYCALWGGFGFEEVEVLAVSTQTIAGEDRKVIEFESIFGAGANEVWIEGIGSTSGFDPIGTILDITDYSLLACFDIAGVNYFFNGATSCDNTTLGISNKTINEAVLFPNPVTTTSILQFASEGLVDTVHIFDINGKQVRSIPVLTDYIRINAMDYRAGLYFYQVSSEGKILKTEKFIVY